MVNHLAAMGDLHRAGRYDRLSDDELTLTGQRPLSVQEFVRMNAATFTASAKAKEAVSASKMTKKEGFAVPRRRRIEHL